MPSHPCSFLISRSRPISPFAFAAIALLVLLAAGRAQAAGTPVYLDPQAPVNQRVTDLLGRMTLEEKIGQMCQYLGPENVRRFALGINPKPADPDDNPDKTGLRAREVRPLIRAGKVGSILDVHTIAESNLLQRDALSTRLKIPLLLGIDAIHGNALVHGATVFPTPISLAATFDPDLVERIARATAIETRAHGSQWTFSPNLDIARDARWGRVGETFGEDPLLVGALGAAMIRGYQGTGPLGPDNVLACLKHLIADSQPANGLNDAPADISERTLREIFLPPFLDGVAAGALTTMTAHNEVGGIPCHANEWLVNGVLRGEAGFPGLVVSDWMDIERLIDMHRVAPNQKEAVFQAVTAGIDMHMHGPGFFEPLLELVREGRITEARIDESARRILRVKFQLGLFEQALTDEARAARVTYTPEHRQLALEAARKSIVLLKNDGGLLPLDPARFPRVLVTGPLADSDSIVGDWVHAQPREHLVTIAQGLKQTAPTGCTVTYFDCGNKVRTATDEAIAGAVRAAAAADVVIVAVGDKTPRTDPTDRTAGENIDRSELDLPGRQLELVQKLAATGKPVVVVLCNGRPLGVPWVAENIPAIVEGGEAGHQGGQAIAEVLFGRINPSGRLPITFPRTAGHIQTTYNHKPSLYHRKYVLGETDPLFGFGHGLSYTTFSYGALTVPATVTPGQPVPVTVEVANTGARAGEEIVLVYVQDLFSSVTTPVKALKAFTRISLAPGERRTVALEIPYDRLALFDRRMQRVVEPGEFEVTVGGQRRIFQVKAAR